MRRNIYFDTNVIVDLFDASRPFHKHSLEVCRNIFSDESVDVFINTDTMTNLFYILRSHVKLNFDDAIAKMDYVKDSFSIVSSDYDTVIFNNGCEKREVYRTLHERKLVISDPIEFEGFAWKIGRKKENRRC